MKTGKINNTQPERTTHHVMYHIIQFEGYDNVISGSKERFHQPDFEVYKHIQNILIDTVNQKCYEDSLKFPSRELNNSVSSVCCLLRHK